MWVRFLGVLLKSYPPSWTAYAEGREPDGQISAGLALPDNYPLRGSKKVPFAQKISEGDSIVIARRPSREHPPPPFRRTEICFRFNRSG